MNFTSGLSLCLPDLGTGQLAKAGTQVSPVREEASGRLGFSLPSSFLSRRSLQGGLGLPSNFHVLSDNQTESINLSLILLTFACLPTSSLSSWGTSQGGLTSGGGGQGGVSERGWGKRSPTGPRPSHPKALPQHCQTP